MNLLTTEHIYEISYNILNHNKNYNKNTIENIKIIKYDNTTIGYLKQLHQPYIDVVESALYINDLIDWLYLLENEFITNSIIKQIKDKLTVINNNDYNNQLIKVKYFIINSFLKNILQPFINYYIDNLNEVILPWDILKIINCNENLCKFYNIISTFNKLPDIIDLSPNIIDKYLINQDEIILSNEQEIKQETKKNTHLVGETKRQSTSSLLLPIIINIGPQQFMHMVTREFTCGLLLFLSPNIANINFHISMFDFEFKYDHFNDINYNNNLEKNKSYPKYSIEICNIKYYFISIDFMHGFSTGAMWINVDHHKYWKNLKMYTCDDNQEKIINMTF